jgi:hypothetical protein
MQSLLGFAEPRMTTALSRHHVALAVAPAEVVLLAS